MIQNWPEKMADSLNQNLSEPIRTYQNSSKTAQPK